MTWIVGTSTLGMAIGVSDIRVTFADGSSSDCLLKLYPVGRDIALGFAGSVLIGFRMVEQLSALLGQARSDQAWDPAVVAEWWQKDAMDIFYDASPDERRCGSEVMLLGASHVEDVGIADIGKVYVFTFSSPRFERVQVTPHDIVAIGSGARAEPYRAALQEVRDDERFIELLVTHRGMQMSLASRIERAVQANPRDDVSPLVHICTVQRGVVEIVAGEKRYLGNDRRNDVILPEVATSYAHFLKLTRASSNAAASSVC